MNHPPIPPNCDWFFKETMQLGTYGFELFDRDYDDWWPLDEIDNLEKAASWRKIVSRVARCAWLDATERDIDCDKAWEWWIQASSFLNFDHGFQEAFWFNSYSIFINTNARLWRVWGEKS